MNPLADVADRALEATVVLSFTKIGPQARSRLFGWSATGDLPRLDGKVVLVTGATSGLGEAAAIEVARLGASVRILARSALKAAVTEQQIRDLTGNDDVRSDIADLASLESVEQFAERFLAEHDRLDVLVHNAGALVHRHQLTDDGIELTLQTHLLAPFLLTQRLLPLLQAASGSRVIFVTSGGMYSERLRIDDLEMSADDFTGPTAYARAKRAQVALVGELARSIPDVGFHAMHPGWVDTPGVVSALPRFHRMLGPLLRSPEEGADTIVWLAAAAEPAALSGSLWLDRRRRATHRFPVSRGSDESAEAARLIGWCTERLVAPGSSPNRARHA